MIWLWSFVVGVLFSKSFLSPAAFQRVQEECNKLHDQLQEEPDCFANGRRFLELDFSHEVVQTLCGTESQDKLRKLLGREELRLAPDTPAEFRSYGVGASMAWHRDDQLYTIPQVECVFTVENLSDSRTEWMVENGDQRSEWTPPNSILAFTAQGAVHRVTPLKKGRRDIVKFVLTATQERTDTYYEVVPKKWWPLGLQVPL
mmetsp:Transcript_14369/g.54200  ORF Transcript_14369/g.54200 Transcript_14369/m.54200 type:complete len:202 (-) Transcript_14369:461-1066(-)